MMMVIYKFSENMNKTILRTKKIPLLQRIGGSMKTLPITCLVKILAEIHCSIYVHSVIHSAETDYRDTFKLLLLLLFAAN